MRTKPFPELEAEPSHRATSLQCPECLAIYRGEGWEEVLVGKALRYCKKCQFPIVMIAGKYRLLHKIKDGQGNILYLAQHKHLDVLRIVKFIKPASLPGGKHKRRFLREVELTSSMSNRSSHIVRVYDDFGEVPSLGFFFVMEYLQGQSLAEFLNHSTPSIALVVHMFHQLCDAVATAHRAGVMHRNLNPENINIVKRGADAHYIKVSGFGIARSLTDTTHVTLQQSMASSPLYLSPEQCFGEDADFRTDIYALGSILYHMLTGAPPYYDESATKESWIQQLVKNHSSKTPIPWPSECPSSRQIPKALEDIAMKALHRDINQRFQTMDEVIDCLEDAFKRKKRTTKPMPAPCLPTREFFVAENMPWESGAIPVLTNTDDVATFEGDRPYQESITCSDLDATDNTLSKTPMLVMHSDDESDNSPTILMDAFLEDQAMVSDTIEYTHFDNTEEIAPNPAWEKV